MSELNIRVALGNLLHDLAPQHGHFQHVGLVNRADPAVALTGQVESQVGNPFNFGFAIDVGVETLTFTVFQRPDTARLTKVNAPGELSHNQDIQPRNDLGFQAGGLDQLRIEDCRAQIAE